MDSFHVAPGTVLLKRGLKLIHNPLHNTVDPFGEMSTISGD